MAKLTRVTLVYEARRTRTGFLRISEIPHVLSKNAVDGPSFFERATVDGATYLDMLKN